ncbi:MAG: ABC transporter permease [Lewinellaceae bacterium]|nr:ABC transporter permease [Lewinellaceae bacterium]
MAETDHNRPTSAYFTIGFLLFLALAGNFFANGKPLYCRIAGETFWPGLRSMWQSPDIPFEHPVLDSIRVYNLWKTFPYDKVVFAPIAFSPGEIIRKPAADLVHPGTIHPGLPDRFRHWLGTDARGRDVAAGLVSGARVAVLTGVTAMAMAMGIGLFLGALSGFWGDERLRIRRGRLWMTLLALPVAWYYAFIARQYILSTEGTPAEFLKSLAVFAGIVMLFNLFGALLSRFPFWGREVKIAADLIIMRLAELFNSIPRLIFIIVVAAMMPKGQSIWLMIALIGAMSWTSVARFVRAELLRIRELDYISAARGLGFPEMRVLWRHALPNALRSTMIIFAIGVGEAILLEAALSFLGFGGEDLRGKSWGSLFSGARSNPMAWWVTIPPGVAICITVLALNSIGEALSNKRKD